MARCLIVGGGCRGRELTQLLRASGHVVRCTTREPARLAEIAASGAEAVLADPDRIGTLLPALDQVAVLILALGSARGSPESLAALHGPRLQALLGKLMDTTLRGVVYEASGTVPAPLLDRGAELVANACGRSRIPYALAGGEAGAATRELADAVELLLKSG